MWRQIEEHITKIRKKRIENNDEISRSFTFVHIHRETNHSHLIDHQMVMVVMVIMIANVIVIDNCSMMNLEKDTDDADKSKVLQDHHPLDYISLSELHSFRRYHHYSFSLNEKKICMMSVMISEKAFLPN